MVYGDGLACSFLQYNSNCGQGHRFTVKDARNIDLDLLYIISFSFPGLKLRRADFYLERLSVRINKDGRGVSFEKQHCRITNWLFVAWFQNCSHGNCDNYLAVYQNTGPYSGSSKINTSGNFFGR